jgi:hypothetical protein
MTDENIVKFPVKKDLDPNAILDDARDKLKDCILLGVTPDGEAYYAICADSPQQVVFLLRTLEHMVIAMELDGN